MEKKCHADRPGRIYPIHTFVEYAKNGGEAQVSAVGYGANQYNGLNAQTDTFTLPRFDEILNAELLRCANKEWDVYFWDSNRMLIGYNDGTDILAGIPMSTVYPGATPFSTSSAKSSMTVNFCHMDAEDSQLNFDYLKLEFNPANVIKGLTEVMLVEELQNLPLHCPQVHPRYLKGLLLLRMRTVISKLLLVKVRFQLNHLLFCTRMMSNGLNLLRWSKRHDCRWSQFCGKAGQDDVEKEIH